MDRHMGSGASGLRGFSDICRVLEHVDTELEQPERQQALLFASTELQYHGTSPIARLQNRKILKLISSKTRVPNSLPFVSLMTIVAAKF